MGAIGKAVGAASVVTGAVGAIAIGGLAQRRAVQRYRDIAGGQDAEFDTLAADRSYTVVSPDGVPLYVEEVGPDDAAVTVVFAHGWTLRSGSWHYQRIDLAGPGFGAPDDQGTGPIARLVFYDQRSHGRSGTAPAGQATLDAVAADLAAVIATAAPSGPVVVVGHSMGGMALLGLAAADPDLVTERLAGFALVGTSAYFDDATQQRPTLLGGNAVLRALTATASKYPRLLERGRPAARHAAWLLTRSFGFADPQVPAHLVDYVDRMISETPVEVIAEFLPAVLEHDLRPQISALAGIPGVVICGASDRMLPPAQSEALARALPDTDLLMVQGAGHNVMLENPAVVSAALRELLRQVISQADRPRAGSKR